MVTNPGQAVGDPPDAALLGLDADRRILLSRRARVTTPPGGQRIYRQELGLLTLPSGQILACDPSYQTFEGRPFTRRVLPGRYAVVVTCVGDGPDPDHHDRIAAAAILLRDELPARWELALCDGQRLADLQPGEIFGYGVDGGTGCFLDTETAAHFTANKRHASRLLREFQKSEYRPRIHTFDDTPAIAMFQSGWGDGFYASYWGLDARGEPVCLVTDFSVLLQPITATLRFGRPAPLTPGRLDHPALARADLEIDVTAISPAALALTARGATDRVQAIHLLAAGDPPTSIAHAYDLTTGPRSADYQLRFEPTAHLILELELLLGTTFMDIVDDPLPPAPRSPVLRRRRAS
jgi:hypothetical protein